MTLTSIDAGALRSVMTGFAEALSSHREVLNLLNVYPVPDGDTGTNMFMTVESVVTGLDELDPDPDLGSVAGAISHGSLMGARGNSGVILSQILRGLMDVVAGSGEVGGRVLADGMASASAAAYTAVMRPVEGTILTVVRESSTAALGAADDGGDLLAVAEAARAAGGEALERTPELLPVLAEAGVVDAGGSGFLLLLDSLLTTLDGRPLPAPPEVSGPAVGPVGDSHPSGQDGTRYEVMYFLDALDDAVPAFKEAWDSIGDSIVVVGGDGIWNCHVHTDDIGAAIEAGIAAGRPHRIRVTDLYEEVEEQAWVRDHIDDGGPTDPVDCAVVAVANGEGLRQIFRSLGVGRVVLGGQSMNPSTTDLLEAVEAVPADEVVLLPNNGNIIPVAEQVDGQTSKTVRVVPTRGVTEGFASLLEYDPCGTADGNVAAMARAASAVLAGEVTVAVRDAGSEAGAISEGDHLGLSGGKVRVIADSLIAATTGLLDAVVTGEHELVTLIEGADADEATTAAIVSWLKAEHPDLEVETHVGGQPLYPYYLGIE
ncbi:MAG: DAK2 domain-containing protein [Acidimicrobiia bacterium]|nr:DAK2 domain-containing protein [Actinomycetota bacterium]MBL6923855.1 DAK2 domain-containing protein [Acidimicrobiia bacterium]MBL6926346.1 DAK2 domain-containing protein [Acidimicrobiia bacterium]